MSSGTFRASTFSHERYIAVPVYPSLNLHPAAKRRQPTISVVVGLLLYLPNFYPLTPTTFGAIWYASTPPFRPQLASSCCVSRGSRPFTSEAGLHVRYAPPSTRTLTKTAADNHGSPNPLSLLRQRSIDRSRQSSSLPLIPGLDRHPTR